jgi:hypothetical protein
MDQDSAWNLELISYDDITEKLKTTLKGSRFYKNGKLLKAPP